MTTNGSQEAVGTYKAEFDLSFLSFKHEILAGSL